MYKILINEADATGQPARGAKCRGIRRVARTKVDALYAGVSIDGVAIVARVRAFGGVAIPRITRLVPLEQYGRKKCRLMINANLPVVVAYDPDTDTGWPE